MNEKETHHMLAFTYFCSVYFITPLLRFSLLVRVSLLLRVFVVSFHYHGTERWDERMGYQGKPLRSTLLWVTQTFQIRGDYEMFGWENSAEFVYIHWNHGVLYARLRIIPVYLFVTIGPTR
jgi:hypothetical protein